MHSAEKPYPRKGAVPKRLNLTRIIAEAAPTHPAYETEDEWPIAVAAARKVASVYEAEKKRLHHEATHDTLTGLLNKRGFYELAQARLARAEPGSVGIVRIDLKNFKRVNDEAGGHPAGDRVLVDIAERLIRITRPEDEQAYTGVGRTGGDEYDVLLDLSQRDVLMSDEPQEDLTPEQRLDRVMGRIYDDLQGYFGSRDDLQALNVNASIGGAVNTETSDLGTLIVAADRHMYEHKRQQGETLGHYRAAG